VFTNEDPCGILRHFGYSRDRVPRTRRGCKLDGDPDYRVQEDGDERQFDFVFLEQCCGRVRLRADCKRCMFKGSIRYSRGCVQREQPGQTRSASSS